MERQGGPGVIGPAVSSPGDPSTPATTPPAPPAAIPPAQPEKVETKPADQTQAPAPATPKTETQAEEKKTDEKKPETQTQGQRPPGGNFPAMTILTPPPDDRVQINMLVPKALKDKLQAEANLACEYGWIQAPTMTEYFTWLVDKYMFETLKKVATQRRAGKEA